MQTQYKFITLNYQKSLVFIIFFSFRITFCQVFCDGGKLHRPGFHPPGRRGQAAQGEGHTPGYLHPGGQTNCKKAASLPPVRRGRGKLPRIQDKPVHWFGMFICTHCILVHARVHVHFYILVLSEG